MRRLEDVVRSVKRHLAESLPEYEVRLYDEQGMFVRPCARIGIVGPTLSGTRSAMKIDFTQPITAYVYPPALDEDGQELSQEGALLVALRTQDDLEEAFVSGLTPYRVPMYDYDGVGFEEPGNGREPHDYMRIVDCSIERYQDTDMPRLFTLAVNLRVTWARETARAQAWRQANIVESVRTKMLVPGSSQTVHVSGHRNPDARFGDPTVTTG